MAKLTPEQLNAYLAEAQKANEKFNAGAGQRPAKVPEGAHRYRILPHWGTKSAATPDAYRRYAQHWVKGPMRMPDATGKTPSNIVATILCHRSTYQQACPVCDAYWQAKQTSGLSKDIEDLIKDANANTKFLVNALHRNGAEPDKVIVLELPYKAGAAIFGDPKAGTPGLFGQAISLIGAYPMDLEDGIDIIIRRSGSGFTTSYSVEFPNPLQSAPVNPAVLDQLVDLDTYVAAFKHTDEDERKAIATLNSLASGSQPNQALLMGGGFAHVQQPAPALAPAYAQAPAPQATPVAAPAPAAVYAPPTAFDADVGDLGGLPTPAPAPDMSDSDIESLLSGLEV